LLGAIAEKRKQLVAKLQNQMSENATSSKFKEFLVDRLEAVSSLTELGAAVALREIEQILKHPIMPRERAWLGATDTVDALARIENTIARSPPNLFVAVNEGYSISCLVKYHLNLDAPIVILRGSADVGLQWDPDPPFRDLPKTIWVIGHVARTGTTLLQAMAEARDRYSTSRVFGAVLAASTDAAENLTMFSFHQLAESSFVELIFDASKQIGIEKEHFILGGERSSMPDVLPVSRMMLDQARVDMARAFKNDK